MFKLESSKTDDLMAELNGLRTVLQDKQHQYDAEFIRYTNTANDLEVMEAKVRFLAELLQKNADLFLPPPPGEGETTLTLLNEKVFAKLALPKSLLWLATAPLVVEAVVAASVGLGAASKTGKLAKFAKGAKFLKVMKFAKVCGAIALAMELTDFIITQANAREINDDLRAQIRKLEDAVDEASAELDRLTSTTARICDIRDDMLREAGVDSPRAFADQLNQGLADLGAQKARLETARRMLEAGLPKDTVMELVGDIDAALLEELAARLQVESELASGQTVMQVSAAHGLAQIQVDHVARSIAARDALLRGEDEDTILETTGVAPATLEELDDRLDLQLRKSWALIDGTDPLTDLAATLQASAAALGDLRQELAIKARLAAGADATTLAAEAGLAAERVSRWADALSDDCAQAATLTGAGGLPPAAAAAACRLPLALVSA